MLNAKLSAAWSTWIEFHRLKCLLDRVGTRWMRQGLVRCMNRWKEQTKENKRLRLLCKRVGARWMKAGLVATMERWRSFVERRLKDKSIVRRWLASVKNRELSSGWRAWIAFVHQCEKDEQVSEVEALRREIADMKKQAKNAVCRASCCVCYM